MKAEAIAADLLLISSLALEDRSLSIYLVAHIPVEAVR